MIPFKPVTLCDKCWVDEIVEKENSPSADYNFGNIYIWDKRYRQLIARCGDRMLTKLRYEGHPAFVFPIGSGPLRPAIEALREFAAGRGYPFVEGTTWTTDAFYRETRAKIERRRQMGAICVEMECAAMQALCDFRGVEFFQFLYAGDNLDHSSWDPRSLSGSARLDDKAKIALLAVELAARI